MTDKTIEREKSILRYLNALDEGNLEQLQQVLRQAETDPLLMQGLLTVHDAYEELPHIIPFSTSYHQLNGAHSEQVKPQVATSNRRRQTRRLQNRGQRVAVLSLLIVILALLMSTVTFTSISRTGFDFGQRNLIPFDELQPITADNLGQLTQLATLGTGIAFDVDWSPDGEQLAISTASGVFLYRGSPANSEPELLGGRPLRVTQAAFSSDGSVLAGVSASDVILWNVHTGEVIGEIETGDAQIFTVQFNLSDDEIGTASCRAYSRQPTAECEEYSLRFWNVATGTEVRVVAIESAWQLKLSPDFRVFAYPFFDSSNSLKVASAQTGHVLANIQQSVEHGNQVFAFSNDGSKLVVNGSSVGNELQIFDVNQLLETGLPNTDTQIESRTTTISGPDFNYLTILPGDEQVFTLNYAGNATIFSLNDDLSPQAVTGRFATASTASVKPDASALVTIEYGGLVRYYDISDATSIILSPFGLQYSNIEFSGSRIAVGSGQGTSHLLRIWQLTDLQQPELLIRPADIYSTMENTVSFAFSPDGKELAYVSRDIRVRDLDTGTERILTEVASNTVLAYTKDEDLVALNGQHILHFSASGELLEQTPMRRTSASGFELIGLSPDGSRVGAGIIDCPTGENPQGLRICTVETIDIKTADLEQTLHQLTDGTPDLFIPASSQLVSSVDNRWWARSACTDIVTTVSDQNNLAFYCTGGQVIVWHIDEEPVDTPITPLILPYDSVFIASDLAFNPLSDSNRILLAVPDFGDHYLRFWQLDATTGISLEATPLASSRRLESSPDAVAFNENGTLLAFSYEGTIQIWGVISEN